MKITNIEAIMLRTTEFSASANDEAQETVIVNIHTNSGIFGVGEVDASPSMLKAVIKVPSSLNWSLSLQDLLIDENPLDVERLWDKMYEGTVYTGRHGLVIHAIGAIDMALWDITEKACGRPTYERPREEARSVCERMADPNDDAGCIAYLHEAARAKPHDALVYRDLTEVYNLLGKANLAEDEIRKTDQLAGVPR